MPVDLQQRPPASAQSSADHVPQNEKGMADLWSMRHLVALMVKRELLSRYKGSMMGMFWTVISPLGQLLLYTFVFSVILNIKFGTTGGTTNFALYMMAALLPFGALSESLSNCPTVIASQPNLVKRVVFPLEILPLVVVVTSIVSQVIGTGILIIVSASMGYPPHLSLAFLPLILLSQFVLIAGLSWLMAGLGVYLTDLRHIMLLVLQAWMYATPIFFPPTMYPPSVKFLLWANPLAGIVTDYRRVLLEGLPPDWHSFATYTCVGICAWCVGYYFFGKTKRSFADVI